MGSFLYWRRKFGRVLIITMVATTWILGAVPAANAFEIKTGNPDLFLSWGNSFRYNLGMRMESRDKKIGNLASADEGDFKFDREDLVTNRLDILSELDFSYQRRLGFRVSGAGWYDAAYTDKVKTNPAFADRGSYSSGKYSSYTKHYHIGPYAELLDANVWGNFEIGEMPANLTVGRQTVLWGEAIALSTNSISYAQAPIDVIKALSTPGVDAKEVAMPITQISAKIQVSPSLALAAQYYLEWRESRLPEGGTYFAGTDFILRGPDRFSVAPGVFLDRQSLKEGDDTGSFGISARWSPPWLDGTVGVYYRKFDEVSPWVSINPAAGTYRAVYAKDTELYGVSLSKTLFGMSTGLEVSYRKNAALNSSIADGSLEGARGETLHVLANAIGMYGPTPLWSLSSVVAELAYSKHLDVDENDHLFNECENRPPGTRDADFGCVTDDNYVAFLRFAPSWVAFKPGWDLAMPMSVSYGLKGNGATLGGGNEGAGSMSVGVTATYNTNHTLGLAYNDYFATYKDRGGSIIATNGSQIQDRGWMSLTYKTNF